MEIGSVIDIEEWEEDESVFVCGRWGYVDRAVSGRLWLELVCSKFRGEVSLVGVGVGV